MAELTADWFANGIIDFEHKKYLLLGYLKYISENFNDKKLYPFLSDLIFHYRNVISLQENHKIMQDAMPKKLRKFDLDNFRLEYTKMMDDDEYMLIIESILNYAIPRIKSALANGKEIYEFVEDKIEIQPIGIVPINKDFGYFILANGDTKFSTVFEYEMSIIENATEKFRSLKTNFLQEYKKQFTQTFESIKLDLLKTHKKFGNPATFSIRSEVKFPMTETLLPIAKRSLVRYLSAVPN